MSGAQAFIDWYYIAVSDGKPLQPFYVNGNAKYAAVGTAADISINGRVCAQPSDYEALLTAQRANGRVRYDIEGFDVHVLNPAFRVACPDHLQGEVRGRGGSAVAIQKASLLVQVAGSIVYGVDKDSIKGGFSEVFVLVPNWDAIGPKAPRGLRGWLIMSQNFRAL